MAEGRVLSISKAPPITRIGAPFLSFANKSCFLKLNCVCMKILPCDTRIEVAAIFGIKKPYNTFNVDYGSRIIGILVTYWEMQSNCQALSSGPSCCGHSRSKSDNENYLPCLLFLLSLLTTQQMKKKITTIGRKES